MGRPRKVSPPSEEEKTIGRDYVKPILNDPRFGYSRPAPKPSQMKKGRDKKEDSDN